MGTLVYQGNPNSDYRGARYPEYLATDYWAWKSKEFLSRKGKECARCKLERWVAKLAYQRDLNVHHKTYEHLGAETDEDLEPLCLRCHRLEHGLPCPPLPQSANCRLCGKKHWDIYGTSCQSCADLLLAPPYSAPFNAPLIAHPFLTVAEGMIFALLYKLGSDKFIAYAKKMQAILQDSGIKGGA